MTQAISRVAKPVSYYVSNPAIELLFQQYGDYLEKLTALQRCIVGCVLFDCMVGRLNRRYTVHESIDHIDQDCALGDRLSDLLIQIVESSSPLDLTRLMGAIAALVGDDVLNEGWS